jgi:septum formation protein
VIEIPVPIVLASSSPTRRELLATLVRAFEAVSPDVDEGAVGAGDPASRAVRLAEAKARQVAARRPDALVIAADTLVVCCGDVIGKPADQADAVRILTKLNRHQHEVLTALFLNTPDGRERSVCARAVVTMRRMSRRQVEDYVASRSVLDKAGAYAIVPDDPHVERIAGSVSTVMGLPLEELSEMLSALYPGCLAKP